MVMKLRDYCMNVFGELLYCIFTVVYLIKLNLLNKELFLRKFESSFELLRYKDFVPLKFFVVAVILFGVGCVFLHRRIRCIFTQSWEFDEMVISVMAILLVSILLITLIVFINNPILRAVCVSVLLVVGVSSVSG